VNSGTFSTQKPALSVEEEIQVPVENVQNDDNVVPQMELPQNSPENERNVMEEIPENRRTIVDEVAQTVPNTRTFVSSLLADNSGLSRSIPMHRNVLRGTGNITLDQNPIPNIDNLLENDEMPILNEMEMARMGIFDGLPGKKISKVLHQREEAAASMTSLSIDTNLAPQNILPIEQAMNPPSVDNTDNLLFTPNPGKHFLTVF